MSVNLPATIYRSTDGLSEFSNEGANDIVDTLDNHLVDTAGNQIVDTGVVQTLLPATVWSQDDSV